MCVFIRNAYARSLLRILIRSDLHTTVLVARIRNRNDFKLKYFKNVYMVRKLKCVFVVRIGHEKVLSSASLSMIRKDEWLVTHRNAYPHPAYSSPFLPGEKVFVN